MTEHPGALARQIHATFDQVLDWVPKALKTEGFGVLTTIDVKATLKSKLGVEMPPYTILGACNPTMAHRALALDPTIGTNLPCNVVVREIGPERVEVRSVDPVETLAGPRRELLMELASQVREMLARAIQRIESSE